MTRFGNALSRAYGEKDRLSRSMNSDPVFKEPARSQELPLAVPTGPVLECASTLSRPPQRSSWTWPSITQRLLEEVGAGFLELANRLRHGSLERNVSSVVFTGVDREVGRSTVMLTLALALENHRPDEALLLLDADFTRASLASAVGLQPPRGLWEILQSDVAPESVLATGPGGRLALLPLSGPITPAELATIGSEGLLPLIAELREQFPLILIDAGPVDASHWTHENSLLWNCAGIDALVHVQRSGVEAPEILQYERRLCRESGMEFLGVIDTFAAAKHQAESTTHSSHIHFSGNRSAAVTRQPSDNF